MVASWVVYSLLVSLPLAAALIALERAVALARLPLRWGWGAGMVALVALMTAAPLRSSARERPEAVVPALSLFDAATDPAPAGAPPMAEQVRYGARAGALVAGARARMDAVVARVEPRAGALALLWGVVSVVVIAFCFGMQLHLARRVRGRPVVEVYGSRVRISSDLGPAVVGVWRPEIVLPRWVFDRTARERWLVVEHERQHVVSRDPLLLAIGWLVAALLPWHPAVWWMLARLRLAVELDCDARVLRGAGATRSYGRLLIELAGRSGGSRVGLTALTTSSSRLERRLIAMTFRPGRFVPARLAALGGVAVTALLAAGWVTLPSLAPARGVAATEIASAAAAPGSGGLKGTTTGSDQGGAVSGSRETGAPPVASSAPEPAVPASDGAAPLGTAGSGPTDWVDPLQGGEPLYLVDGAVADSARVAALRANPDQVARVSVLKGEAAAAQYGARGRFGVVLVTTREGAATLPAPPPRATPVPEVLHCVNPAGCPRLYVVDGIVVPGNPLASMDANDIDNIVVTYNWEVAGLYRAGPGVAMILVTTKPAADAR